MGSAASCKDTKDVPCVLQIQVPTLIGCSLLKSDSLHQHVFAEKRIPGPSRQLDFFTALLRVSSEEAELWGVIFPMSNAFLGPISFSPGQGWIWADPWGARAVPIISRRRLAGAILDKKTAQIGPGISGFWPPEGSQKLFILEGCRPLFNESGHALFLVLGSKSGMKHAPLEANSLG